MTSSVPVDTRRAGVMALASRLAPHLGAAFGVLLADQASKAAAARVLVEGEVVHVGSFADLVLAHNRGAAFSLFADASGWQRWLFIGLAIAVAMFILRSLAQPNGEPWSRTALALVLGGALGNVADRLWHGHVVDFISLHWREVYYFPAFNVADCAITVGTALLVFAEIRRSRTGGNPSAAA
ncbi:signal peptidase II [Variovorax sp. VaC1]|uniref:signal peptidase II n=1 Tax=Variovorax sp. VaC1 TaxID=3373132 RepID=UPI00374A17E3